MVKPKFTADEFLGDLARKFPASKSARHFKSKKYHRLNNDEFRALMESLPPISRLSKELPAGHLYSGYPNLIYNGVIMVLQ